MHDVPVFDRFAPAYDLVMPSADPAVLEAGLSRADRRIDHGLDLGGGTGRAARALTVGDWTVVDAARGMLRVARTHGLPTVQADGRNLPVADESVDAVVVVDALHHLPEADRVLSETARVLRPGGVLVVREFDPTTLRGRALVAAERVVGFDSSFFSPTELVSMAERAGLRATLPDTGFGYTMAATKPGEA